MADGAGKRVRKPSSRLDGYETFSSKVHKADAKASPHRVASPPAPVPVVAPALPALVAPAGPLVPVHLWTDAKRYDDPYSDKEFRVVQPAEDPAPGGDGDRRNCRCCKAPRSGACGLGHACRKTGKECCYLRLCRLSAPPPLLPLSLIAGHPTLSQQVQHARVEAHHAWRRLLAPFQDDMLRLRQLGTKSVTHTVNMSALSWSIGMVDVKAAGAWLTSFPSARVLDAVFGTGWDLVWQVATQPMKVTVFAGTPIQIKLQQKGNCRADAALIPGGLDAVDFSLALLRADRLVTLVWTVTMWLDIERCVPSEAESESEAEAEVEAEAEAL